MGTYNSGCAKIKVPVLNQDPDGPMLMVSHANTNPGLTKTWDPGEPDKYYPTGKRNYARVVTTDDFQGTADAQFTAKDLKSRSCYVLNDNQTYGQGVAKAFVDNAKKSASRSSATTPWDAKQPNYTALFQKIKAKNPDCIFLAGIYDNNGGQLVKDKVKVLGDNTRVKMMGPDGFTGYPDLQKQKEAEGMYISFAGLRHGVAAQERWRRRQVPGRLQGEVRRGPGDELRLYGVRRCRSSWRRSRGPTAPARASPTRCSAVPGSPSPPTCRSSARRSSSTPRLVTSTTRTSASCG